MYVLYRFILLIPKQHWFKQNIADDEIPVASLSFIGRNLFLYWAFLF